MKSNVLYGICLLLLVLSGCTADPDNRSGIDGNGETTVNFVIKLPAATPVTRALSEANDERDIQQVDILLFDDTSGAFIYRVDVPKASIAGTGTQRTFTVKMRVGAFDMVVLANAHDIINAIPLNGMIKQNALKLFEATIPSGDKWIADASAVGYKPFPMWGDVGVTEIGSETAFTGTEAIELTRMMARVDVVIGAGVENFQLTGIDVYNYNTKGSVVPTVTGSWGAGVAVAPSIPASSSLTMGPVSYTGTEIDAANNRCFTEIYLFEAENHTGSTHITAKSLTGRTCLVMGGKFDAAGDGFDDDPITYYRMDFSKGTGASQTFLDVLRNHKYTFTITRVSGPGCADSQTAFESIPYNIEVNIVPWNERYTPDPMDDKLYYFSIVPLDVEVPYNAGSTATVTIESNITDFVLSLDDTELSPVGTKTYSSSYYNYTLSATGTETYTLTIEALGMNRGLVSQDRLEEWTVAVDHGITHLSVTQEWRYYINAANLLYFNGGNLGLGKYLNPDGTPGLVTIENIAYFKAGSVIGFRGSPDVGITTAWNNDYIAYNPSRYVVNAAGPNDGNTITGYGDETSVLPGIPGYVPETDYVAGYANFLTSPAYHNGANIRAGKGDPCKLVDFDLNILAGMTESEKEAALDAYDSGWRLSTEFESISFIGGPAVQSWSPGVYVGYENGPIDASNPVQMPFYYGSDGNPTTTAGTSGNVATGRFPVESTADYTAYSQVIPAVGYRSYSSDGRLFDFGRVSWTASYNDIGIVINLFDQTTVIPNVAYGEFILPDGLPVRCVYSPGMPE